MATQLDEQDEIDRDEEDNDPVEDPQDDAHDDGADPGEPEPEGDDDDDVVSFAGARVADADEPEGMRNLRSAYREERRRREELEAAIAPPVEHVGPEPTLDDDDVQWNEAAFKEKWAKWSADKAKADRAGAEQREQAEAAKREWEADLNAYQAQKAGLKVRDYDAAEDRVVSTLSEMQHALLIQASTNKAALKYALGKNADKLDALAKITNPVKFTAAVARLDMETTVQKRRPTTQPETAVRGSGGFTKGKDAKLERLEKEAARTNDRTDLIAYKRELRDRDKK